MNWVTRETRETREILGTIHRTQTNKAKITTRELEEMSNTDKKKKK